MDDNLGLIEVKAGQTAAGREYIYSIRKLRDETEGIPKCVYLLNFNIRFEKGIQFISGSFDEVGMTGIRDSLAYSMMRNEGGPLEGKEFGDLEGWCADPYDPNFKRGFLMNLSEDERLDEMFSTHPLSVARKFVRDIISLN